MVVFDAPAVDLPGHHVRSTLSAGPNGDRRPAGVLHAYSNSHSADGTVCGLSGHGLYWFGRIAWTPRLRGACRACIEATRLAA